MRAVNQKALLQRVRVRSRGSGVRAVALPRGAEKHYTRNTGHKAKLTH